MALFGRKKLDRSESLAVLEYLKQLWMLCAVQEAAADRHNYAITSVGTIDSSFVGEKVKPALDSADRLTSAAAAIQEEHTGIRPPNAAVALWVAWEGAWNAYHDWAAMQAAVFTSARLLGYHDAGVTAELMKRRRSSDKAHANAEKHEKEIYRTLALEPAEVAAAMSAAQIEGRARGKA